MFDSRTPQPRSPSSGSQIVAVATVLSLVISLLGFLYGQDLLCRLGFENRLCPAGPVPGPQSPGEESAPRIPAPQGPDDEPAPGGRGNQPEPPARSSNVRWAGQFLLRMINGADLDTVPTSAATGPAGNYNKGDLFYDNREALGNWLYAGNTPVAVWRLGGKPNANGCADAITTVGLWKISPEPGQELCVATTAGRIAALKVVEAQYGGVLFDVTVWD